MCMCVCICACMCVYVRVCVCACLCVCMNVWLACEQEIEVLRRKEREQGSLTSGQANQIERNEGYRCI